MADKDYEILLKIRADIAQAIAGLGQVNDRIKQTHTIADGVGGALKNAALSLAGFIGLGAALEGIKGMFAEIFANADSFAKLNQQTGLSTDTIQGLTEAARENNIAQDVMAGGLDKLTIAIGKARTGSSQALQPFRDLQINFKDFQKLAPDQQFQLLAQRLVQVKDPADEARIGVQLFGKQFLDLKPAIEAAANEGIQSFLDKAKELGVYMSGDMIAQLKAVHDQMGDIKTETQGIATEFLSGFAPALETGLGSLIKSTSGATNGFKTLGEWIGTAFKSVLLVIEDVGAFIGVTVAADVAIFKTYWNTAITVVKDEFRALGAYIDLALHGHLIDAARAFQDGMKKAVADAKAGVQQVAQLRANARDQLAQSTSDNAANLFPGGSKAASAAALKKPDTGIGISTGDLKQLLQARNALLQTELANELKLYEAQATLKSTQEQADYEQGRLSLKQYFDDRGKIINGQYDLEIKALKAQQAQLAANPVAANDKVGALQKQNDLAKVAGDLAQKELARQQALLSLTLERQQAERQLFQDKLQAEARIATLEGNRVQAERDLLKIELQQLDLQLRKAGIPDAQREQALALAQQQGEAKANFDDATRNADAAMNSLQTAIADVNNQVASGQLFATNGELRIAQIEKDRLPALQQLAQAQLAAAQASGDPQLIAQAEAFNQKLKEIATSADLAGQHMAQFKADAQNAFESGLYEFLTTGITQVHSLGDAFRQLGLSIAQAMEQAAAKQLSLYLTQKLFSLLDHQQGQSQDVGQGALKLGLASGTLVLAATMLGTNADKLQQAADTMLIADAVSLAAATGGLISGPGTATSDSIQARLSTGEYVQRAAAVDYYGVNFMHDLNALRVPMFADGGLVSDAVAPPIPMRRTQIPQAMVGGATAGGRGKGSGAAPSIGVRIVNNLDPKMALDAMDSPDGEALIMNTISRNQTKIRQMVR